MTGSRGKVPSLPQPPPLPTPLEMSEETEEAKRRARARRKGRPSTILAGRLMSEHGKRLLGE